MDLTDIINQALSMSAVVPGKTLVLYSGLAAPNPEEFVWNSQAAFQIVADDPVQFYTIYQTPAGSYLADQVALFEASGPLSADQLTQIDQAWQTLSLMVAQQAQGNVLACVAGNVNPDGVFGSIEYPALLKNSLVSSINNVSTLTLDSTPATVAIPGILGPASTCYSQLDPNNVPQTALAPLPAIPYSDPVTLDTSGTSGTQNQQPIVQATTNTGSTAIVLETALALVAGAGVLIATKSPALAARASAGILTLLGISASSTASSGDSSETLIQTQDLIQAQGAQTSNSILSQGNQDLAEALAIAPDLAYASVEDDVESGTLPASDLGFFATSQVQSDDLGSFLTGSTAPLSADVESASAPTDDVTVQNEPNGSLDINVQRTESADTYISGLVEGATADQATDIQLTQNDTLILEAPLSFTGTIASLGLGDTIDLFGISATGATLGAGNVLTAQENEGGGVNIQLDPTQNLSDVNFGVSSDGSGGSDIAPNQLLGLNDLTHGTFSIINPETGGVNAYGATFGGVLPVTGSVANGNYYFVNSGGPDPNLVYLFTVNVQTGALTNEVPFNQDTFFTSDNATGELVGLSYSSSTATFCTVDPATGAVDAFGASFSGENVYGETALNDKFYCIIEAPSSSQEYLCTINIGTGQLLSEVPTTATYFVGDDLTGELVGLNEDAFNPADDPTFCVTDPTTGAVTTLGASFPNTLVTFAGTAAGGKFYFTGSNTTTHALDLYTIDIQTGQLLSEVPTTQQFFSASQPTLICFVAGTQIATPAGEVPVEQLAVAEEVLTLRGEARRIVWIGTGRVLATRGRRNAATPVIVRKGALADNVPHHDLRVTKAHSLYIDHVLIPVEFLVNHHSIIWDDHAQEVTLYHIELETHDVLLANGAPAESYRDDGNRWLFQNANSGWGLPSQEPYAPVFTGGPIVDAVWRRLLERAGPRKNLPLTDDADLHVVIDGERMDAVERAGDVHVFHLSKLPSSLNIVSRAAAPAELGLARDPRVLGVALRRLVVRKGSRFRVTEANDNRLTEGFHEFEEDNGFRWTAGDAAIPTELCDGFTAPLELVVQVAATARYFADGPVQRVA